MREIRELKFLNLVKNDDKCVWIHFIISFCKYCEGNDIQ